MVTTILVFVLYFGFIQRKGKANGPIHKKTIIKNVVVKYQGVREDFGVFKNSPQKRHFTASSLISSAQ